MNFFELIVDCFDTYSAAFVMTIKLAAISLVAASVIGIIFGLFKISHNKILRVIANVYIEIIRGTPLMVQIFVIYFGLGGGIPGFSWSKIGGAFTAGVVTLTINAGAYMAEIVRGGIESVDRGQMEAARSLGLSYGKAMVHVILPQAIRTMLPSIINQFIISLKDTSLISVIGVRELTNNGRVITATSANEVLPLWIIVALYYLLACLILSWVAKVVERKLSYGRKN